MMWWWRHRPPMMMAGSISRSRKNSSLEHAQKGADLVGPGGLLGDLTKQILETGLEVELDEHLAYTKHDSAGRNGGNSRNGTRSKTVITEVGPVDGWGPPIGQPVGPAYERAARARVAS